MVTCATDGITDIICTEHHAALTITSNKSQQLFVSIPCTLKFHQLVRPKATKATLLWL